MALRHGGDELLNKLVIFIDKVNFVNKYFQTFLGLDNVIYLVVNGTVASLSVFIQNILNWVLKTNKAFTGLERHGG